MADERKDGGADYILGWPDNETFMRDWYAGMALVGFHAHPANPDRPEHVADYCYRIADAMLTARQKGGDVS